MHWKFAVGIKNMSIMFAVHWLMITHLPVDMYPAVRNFTIIGESTENLFEISGELKFGMSIVNELESLVI